MSFRGACVAALCAASCGSPPVPAQATFWSAADLLRLQRGVESPGEPLHYQSPPYATSSTQQESGFSGLTVFPAFSETQPAAYVTTEQWFEFPAVWIQPLYVPVKAFTANGVDGYPDFDAVFAIDVTSRFYSPYWQIFYFVSDKPKGFWKSSKQILDAGVELREGPGKFCAIVPEKLRIARAAGDVPRRPLTGEPVGDSPTQGHGYVDGHDVWFFDLGVNRFTWNRKNGVVDETALFRFARAGPGGAATPTDLPSVGGTGDFRDARPWQGGAVQFGSLWRIYDVVLPATAGVFVPSSLPALRRHAADQGLVVPDPGDPVETQLGAEFTLRVALNASACFKGTAPCQWLDSQGALESLLPDWRFTKTGWLVSCPLLLFSGKPVGQQ